MLSPTSNPIQQMADIGPSPGPQINDIDWFTLRPTFRGKTVAAVNMMGLTIALGPIIPVWFSTFAAAVMVAALTWSFAIDVRRLWLTAG
jgi:hypothetical protein